MSIIEQALNRLDEQQKKKSNDDVAFHNLLQGAVAVPPPAKRLPLLYIAIAVVLVGGLFVLVVSDTSVSLNIGKAAAPVPHETPIRATTEVQQTTALTTSATVEAETALPPPVVAASDPVVLTESVADVLPIWLSRGYVQFENGREHQAIQIWTQALAKLPPTEKLIAWAVYRDATSAIRALRKVSGRASNAFVVQSYATGMPAWRLVMWPVTQKPTEELRATQKLFRKSVGEVITLKTLRDYALENGPPTQSRVVVSEPEVKPLLNSQGLFNPQSERIVKALNNSEFALASELTLSLLPIYPHEVEPLLWMAKAQLGLKNFSAAKLYLDRALESYPHKVEAWLMRGVLAQEQGKHSDAISFFSKAEQLAPDHAGVYFNLGYSYQSLKRDEEALRAWNNFLKLSDGNIQFSKQRTYVEQRLGIHR